MILSLQTTTFGAHGGIPTYNRLVCKVLNEICDLGKTHVLIATDTKHNLEDASLTLSNLQFSAFDRNRFKFVVRFLKLVLADEVDLVLIGHVNYAPLGLMLKLLKPRIRYGVMVHGIEVWAKLPALKRRALERADFITSVSEFSKDQVVSLNSVPSDRIYILPNALEVQASDDSNANLELPAGLKLLSVCRLDRNEQYKGVDTVIDALPAVIQEIPTIQYYVIGDGTDLERHKALAKERGVDDRVHFLGSVNASMLHAYYRACDVFVMPSAGEGFGIVYLEAMSHGKPVVAARSGAAPEVVLDGITGRLVAYGSKEQLADVLMELCLDPKQRHRLGSAGHRRLHDNFTFKHFKATFDNILVREMAHTPGPKSEQVVSGTQAFRIDKNTAQ